RDFIKSKSVKTGRSATQSRAKENAKAQNQSRVTDHAEVQLKEEHRETTSPEAEPAILQGTPAPGNGHESRYVPKQVCLQVRLRSGDRCEYVDPVTKRRCSSRTGLQFDHVKPFAMGGRTELN